MRTSLALVVASLLSVVPALSRANDPAAPDPAAKPAEKAAAPRERDAKPAEGEAAKPADPAKPADAKPVDAKATPAPKGAKPAATKDPKTSGAAPAEKPCEPVKPCAID
jgi:hypothetical protein